MRDPSRANVRTRTAQWGGLLNPGVVSDGEPPISKAKDRLPRINTRFNEMQISARSIFRDRVLC